jgi:hypothetical protein
MFLRIAIRLLPSAALSLVMAGSAAAQCAMCRATLAGDPNAVAASHRMNMAVLMLLIPAIVIFSGFFVLMYRYRNSFRNSAPAEGFDKASDEFRGSSNMRILRGSTGPQC